MKPHAIAALSALLATLTPALATAADEQWEITTHMEVSGLPLRMPATTVLVCVPPGGMNEERIVERDGCAVGKVTRSGQTTRFSVQCSQPQPMSGEGEITRGGTDAYNGKFSASGKFGDREVTMNASFSGKRTGDCVVAPATAGAATATHGNRTGIRHPEGFDLDDPATRELLRRLQQESAAGNP